MSAARRWLSALTLTGAALAAGPALAQTSSLKVVATIKPVHALVSQVMGDTGTPSLIVSGSASLHSYAMKPSDARAIADADLVVRVSEALEPFAAKALKSLSKKAAIVSLINAPGVATLKVRETPDFEQHAHASAGKHAGHDHDDKGQIDGHIWLDPDNAAAMVNQIAASLAEKDPARAGTYRANAAKAKDRIATLSRDLEAILKPIAGRPYIVLHDAYQYLEARYRLTPVGAITTSPEVPPSGKRLAALREKVRRLGAACIFSEPVVDAKVIRSVAEGSAARSAQLDPEAITLQPGPDLYDALMRKMAGSIRECLAPAS